VDCEHVRHAISALLDGEEPGLPPALIESHLENCPACTEWRAAAAALVATTQRLHRQDPPDGSLANALAAISGEFAADAERERRRHLLPWRVGLVGVAILQPLLAIPALLAEHEHEARELSSWHLALAVGFLFAAARPLRAWGMLPLVVALVTGLLLTAGIDVADGEASVRSELMHVLDVGGLACLWALARAGRPVFRTRLA
jgi:predicted anti-sigma-YlaC factor YlaD